MGEVPDLFAQVVARVENANTDWIHQLFQRYGGLDLRARCSGRSEGYHYVFKDAVLRTRLAKSLPCKTDGAKCGDNGGKTQKGTPCRLKAGANGRCAKHPPVLEETVHRPGECIPELVVDWGDDQHHRPIGGSLAWDKCRVSSAGVPDVWPVDLHGTTRHFSAAEVWNQVILEVKEQLGLRPVGTYTHHGVAYPADPLWTTERFMLEHGVTGLDPGNIMEDLGVCEDSEKFGTGIWGNE